MASTRVVFPWSTWAMIARLRMLPKGAKGFAPKGSEHHSSAELGFGLSDQIAVDFPVLEVIEEPLVVFAGALGIALGLTERSQKVEAPHVPERLVETLFFRLHDALVPAEGLAVVARKPMRRRERVPDEPVDAVFAPRRKHRLRFLELAHGVFVLSPLHRDLSLKKVVEALGRGSERGVDAP